MALSTRPALDSALIIISVICFVVGGVEMGYFLIFSTIIHDYKLRTLLAAFADLSISWRWWLPLICGMACLLARGKLIKAARARAIPNALLHRNELQLDSLQC